ncbi:MAG: nicotinate-nucleotide adenylyltransferase [Acidimicrobiales bacterium]
MVRARIGLLGGTFDPVHIGHLLVASEVRGALALDKVLLVVANEPWQKSSWRAVTSAVDRLDMVARAVEDVPGVEASAIEIERGGPSYTIDTVRELRSRCPGIEVALIVGADVAAELGTWHRSEELRNTVELVVVDRSGSPPAQALPGWAVTRVRIPSFEVSSSDVRDRLARGEPIHVLVPEAVIRLIAMRGLYALER